MKRQEKRTYRHAPDIIELDGAVYYSKYGIVQYYNVCISKINFCLALHKEITGRRLNASKKLYFTADQVETILATPGYKSNILKPSVKIDAAEKRLRTIADNVDALQLDDHHVKTKLATISQKAVTLADELAEISSNLKH